MLDLEEELKRLPVSLGVYPMYNDRDKIIYIGKAISLKNRVCQYLQSSRNKTAKIEQMVSHIAWSEYILAGSEPEVLVLECNLIKEHRPRYNTMLKNDKSYPYIKATTGGDYPRLLFARDMEKDSRSKYFGPYTSAGAVKDTLDLIHKLCRIRTCSRSLPKDIEKDRPRLDYHIKQCDAPYQGYISREDYQASFSPALDFLNGKYDPPTKTLEERIQNAPENLDSERAIEYRELLNSVKQVAQKQKITSSSMEDRDIVTMAKDEKDAVVQVFFTREGKLIGRDHFHVSATMAKNEGEILDSFAKQFYAGMPFILRELWLQHPLADEEVTSQQLIARRGQKARIVVPKKGEKERLVELAARNAELVLSQDKEQIKKEELYTIGVMNQIGELIGIGGIRRMEAFDILNTSGVESVGFTMVYKDGKPERGDYRKFRIRTVQGPNDYASTEEMPTRRFSHGMREVRELEDKGGDLSMGSFTRLPDLIVMDGGREQVNIALEVLDKLGPPIPARGMVRDDNHRTRGLYFNNIEVSTDRHSGGFRLITRIQNEARRLVIRYYRSLRGKGQMGSILDDIPEIGPARRKALMRYFKDIESVCRAGVEELERAPQMNRHPTQAVYDFFHKPVDE